MLFTTHGTCRVCEFPLNAVIDLGEQYIQGAFIKPGKPLPPLEKVPTTLGLCPRCGLLQMLHTVDPGALYSNYWYRSGTNQTMRDHLQGIVNEAISINRKETCKVLDIGCNDGTLLNAYPAHFTKVGIDPSNIPASPTFELIRDRFPCPVNSKFDIITSIAMFYDLDDPVEFAVAIREILEPDGIWIIELAYLPSMLSMNSYDTICAEHLEYYSLHSLRSTLMHANLWAFRATGNKINGGSIRIYATHSDSFNYKVYRGTDYDLFDSEDVLGLFTQKPYREFQARIEQHRDELRTLIFDLKERGKRIHVYGASTKGNTILQWCGLDHTVIDFAADRNPDKFGARTIGSNIEIISEEESRKMKPDYYLVLPWHFAEEFLARERETIANGTGMIFPLPRIRIVEK